MRKITNFTPNSFEMSFFPGNFEGAETIKTYETNSQGNISVIIFVSEGNGQFPTGRGGRWGVWIFGFGR